MIGQTISHYKIIEKLGEGGMGVVYKAQDMKLDRIVALKFLPHHLIVNEAEQARFLQEAKAASALNHPNVCGIHSIGEHEGPAYAGAPAGKQSFIDMEFVEGQTLRTKVASKTLKLNDAIVYAIQIGEALHEAHSKGIVHRDVKAENIMVNSKNQIKVMDFGLAKLKGSLKLTKTSSTVGTLAYMAPEQIQGGEADARSDIFSFGVVLFEMLTGHMPFRGEHEAAMLYSIVNEEPESVQKHRNDISADIDRIIHRALEKDPEDRYQHIDDMVSELRRVQKQSARVSRPTSGEIPDRPTVEKIPEMHAIDHAISGIKTTNQSHKRTRRFLGLGIILVLLVVTYIGYVSFFDKHQSIDSIAVLPFENVGADPNTEYLSDGTTESIINSLSQLPSLRVIPRSTVFGYKRKNLTTEEIGNQLKVRAVLTGRVIQRGDNLDIQVELVDLTKQAQLWGQRYVRKVSDLLSVHEEIVRELLSRLQPELTGGEKQQISKRPTENTEAYQLYLKGRYQTSLWTPDGARKGLDYLQRAVELDPDFALGYAGLGKGYYDGSGILLQHTEGMPKARENLEKALSLNDNLQEAHLYLGVVKMLYDCDWKGAEREYKLAMELKPNDAEAHAWHAYYLMSIERKSDDALIEAKNAIDLDPRSFLANLYLGKILYFTKQYDGALNQFQNMLDLDINPAFVELYLADCYAKQKRYDEALALLERNATKYGRTNANLFALGRVYAKMGEKSEAQETISELNSREKNQFVRVIRFVNIYIELGELVHAFDVLQRAYEQREENLIELNVNPLYDPIRNDPRFKELVKKIGLPQ